MATIYFDIGGTPKLTSTSDYYMLEYQTFNLGGGEYQVNYHSVDKNFSPQADSVIFPNKERQVEKSNHVFILNRLGPILWNKPGNEDNAKRSKYT